MAALVTHRCGWQLAGMAVDFYRDGPVFDLVQVCGISAEPA
jgi:hypothetical protein